MAFFQDAYMNFPFQSWEMRPLGKNHCCLSIIAAVVEVEIEVRGDKCYVMRGEDDAKNAWAENLFDKPMIVPHLVEVSKTERTPAISIKQAVSSLT